jgi:hypothetical protein
MKAFVRLRLGDLAHRHIGARRAWSTAFGERLGLRRRNHLDDASGQPSREIQIRGLTCIQPVSLMLWSNELVATHCRWQDGYAAVELPISEAAVSLFHLLKGNNAMNKSNSGANVYVGRIVTCPFANARNPQSAKCDLF